MTKRQLRGQFFKATKWEFTGRTTKEGALSFWPSRGQRVELSGDIALVAADLGALRLGGMHVRQPVLVPVHGGWDP